MGLYGLVIGIVVLFVYMCSLDSYGAPLLAPYAPLVKSDLKDGITKKEVTEMGQRPASFHVPNKTRMVEPKKKTGGKSPAGGEE